MMETFTASNGCELSVAESGHLMIPTLTTGIGEVTQQALREFFLHERDGELGRWRWPKDRNYVVYFRSHGDRFVYVYHEPSMGLHTEYRDLENDTSLGYSDAAQAFFAAHPVPKPWHAAQPGEAWVITYGGEEYAVISDGAYFLWQAGSEQAITDSLITDAHRIWPEAPSE